MLPNYGAMLAQVAKLALVLALLSNLSLARAEGRGKGEVHEAELAAELIGAPVLARDGDQVGTVADVSFDDEGNPLALRMKASRHLGLGTRTIQVPKGAFITLRGAVVLQLPAEAVQSLSEVSDPEHEK
jgi:sporulation protein YlmC with PRC-barrel domain